MKNETPTPEEVLQSLNIVLPAAPDGVGNYRPYLITGDYIYTSGQLPFHEGKLIYTGRLGKELSPEEGYQSARISAINAISQLKNAVGSLNRIEQIIRIDGHVQSADGFKDIASVLNGASDLFNTVFGKAGLHTRSAIGIYQAPMDAATLIYVIAKFK